MPNKNHLTHVRNRLKKANTNKLVSKLVHVVTKKDRQKKKKLEVQERPTEKPKPHKLKFGSINVDGMDLQTDDAVRSIIVDREIDVSNSYENCNKEYM